MLRVAILGLVIVLLSMQFKKQQTEFGFVIGLAGCAVLFFYAFLKLDYIIEVLKDIIEYTRVSKEYISILLKILGITFVAEFASDLCKDSGHAAVGNQIELISRLSIVALSMPIVYSLIQIVEGFLS